MQRQFLDNIGVAELLNELGQYLKEVKADKTDLNNKQDKLISGTNIKTVNNNSLLGSGDIEVNSNTVYYEGQNTAYVGTGDTLTESINQISDAIDNISPNQIESIIATESSASGGNNTVTITETDGTITTFNVKNGVDGVSLGEVALMQTTGDSEESVMSQKAVTEYGRKVTAEDLDGTSEWIRAKLTEEGWEFGKYLYTNAIKDDAAYCVTPLIPINNIIGHSLTWDIGVIANQIKLWYIDANGTRTGYVDGGTSSSSTRTITVASSAANATHLRISLSASNLPHCYIFDNTTGEYLLKVDEILSESCEDCNLPYGVFENTLLTQEEGDSSFKTMSQKAITKAIKYNMSITNCSCVYMDKAANFNLTDQQLKAFNSTDIITISFTIMPVLTPLYNTPWRYLKMYGATSLSSTDGFVMNCASSGRMYMQTGSANNEPSNAAFNLLNSSIICPAVFNIVWDRVNGIVRFYERANLVTEKQDDKYKLSQFMREEKILYFFPADGFSYLYDLQIYDYDIIGILDSDINGRSGASYINPVYDGNLKVLDAEWTASGPGTYGNTAQLPYTYEDGNVIITSTDAAVAGTTATNRGYYVGTSNIARIYESDIEVVSGTCKIINRTPSVLNEIVDRNTGTVYAAGDELGVGEYTIKGRASTTGCWVLTYMSGSPMVVKHTANRQKYISCIMHLKCDTLYNGELYDDQADVFYDVPVAPDNTSFNKIQLTTSNKPYFAGQMALSGNNVYVGDKNYTWKQINNS